MDTLIFDSDIYIKIEILNMDENNYYVCEYSVFHYYYACKLIYLTIIYGLFRHNDIVHTRIYCVFYYMCIDIQYI